MTATTRAKRIGVDGLTGSGYTANSTERREAGLHPYAPCGSRSGSWYCVVTKAQSEIQADCELRQQGFATYLPLEAKPGGIVPIFPRYMFAQQTERSPSWGAIRSTRGVTDIITRSGSSDPAVVPIDALSELWAMCEPNGVIYRFVTSAPIKPGDRVTITAGWASGWSGICQKSARERVDILMATLGGRTISVRRDHVAPAGSAPTARVLPQPL